MPLCPGPSYHIRFETGYCYQSDGLGPRLSTCLRSATRVVVEEHLQWRLPETFLRWQKACSRIQMSLEVFNIVIWHF